MPGSRKGEDCIDHRQTGTDKEDIIIVRSVEPRFTVPNIVHVAGMVGDRGARRMGGGGGEIAERQDDPIRSDGFSRRNCDRESTCRAIDPKRRSAQVPERA
jgi:hypothetical protein